MDPKATTPILNPLGTRFVATWPEDCSGWQVTRHEPGEAPISADAFMDSLSSRLVQHWYDTGLYRTRHLVENSFNRLKNFRRLSLRFDKIDTNFRAFAAFAAAILNWQLKVKLCP